MTITIIPTTGLDLLKQAQIAAQAAKADKAARKAQKEQKARIAAFQAFLDMVAPAAEVDETDILEDLHKWIEGRKAAHKVQTQALFTFRDNLPMGDSAVEADIRAQWVRNGWTVTY